MSVSPSTSWAPVEPVSGPHTQCVSHIADFNQNIQAAMEAPRFTKLSFHGCDLDLENRLPGATIAELKAKGHLLQMHNGCSNRFGGGQAVMRDFGTCWRQLRRLRSAQRWRRRSRTPAPSPGS